MVHGWVGLKIRDIRILPLESAGSAGYKIRILKKILTTTIATTSPFREGHSHGGCGVNRFVIVHV
ncbi:hypothetical protein TH53_15365 [Pedobacter lusitanus]|uniref:Uncharacterized protein n=1 Tax=Pedobacter lusitanus TaxID=1503925 RepID=A0A0D0F460_9SPHI|nr:hypothetical protein TH53_15365 [Pedobacter lusitanus]